MKLLILKATVKGIDHPDLFASPSSVKGYVRGGHAIAPYIAIRKKAAPEIARTKLVVLAHPAPMAQTTIAASKPRPVVAAREIAIPDTNSNDPDQVLAWVRKIKVGGGDVINDRSISREAENRYYVQGHKSPISYIGRVVELLTIGAKRYKKQAP